MIYLNDLLHIDKSEYCKWTICLNNATNDGVYSLKQNKERLLEHISWKKHSGTKTSFRIIDTELCLQFIRLDKDNAFDRWLFLGAFKKEGNFVRYDDGHEVYNLVPIDAFGGFSERLIIEYHRIQGPKQVKLPIESIETLPVVTILEKPYIDTYMAFPGYDNLNIEYSDLKTIIQNNVDSWRILLENVKCIYAITDVKTGKIYIGGTYGGDGVWQRWSNYVETGGHGGDVELKKLVASDPSYALNFKFTIIETLLNKSTDDEYIQKREKYWKGVFDTRKHGNNRN